MRYTYKIDIDEEELDRLINIRGYRSRAVLSKACGWDDRGQMIHRYMSKNPKYKTSPSLQTLGKICTALHCTPGDLIKYELIPIYEAEPEAVEP